jgi:hypothetical protein
MQLMCEWKTHVHEYRMEIKKYKKIIKGFQINIYI